MLPSLLKSAATALYTDPMSDWDDNAKLVTVVAEGRALPTVKKATFDRATVPGLPTVTDAVAPFDKSAAAMVAVSWPALTNCVTRAEPFQ
jgi:hypothetical protein